MRRICILFLLSCGACHQTPPEQPSSGATAAADTAAQPAAPRPAPLPADDFLDPAWFKVARLDTFSVVVAEEKLVKLTPAQEKRYLQQKQPYSRYTPSYFYSLQQNTPVRQEITVLTYDGEYMSNLWRLVYDARHHLISRQKVAGTGADGGQETVVTGLFETPAHFRLTTRNSQADEDSTGTVRYDIDSTVAHYAVDQEQLRPVGTRTYQRRYVTPQ